MWWDGFLGAESRLIWEKGEGVSRGGGSPCQVKRWRDCKAPPQKTVSLGTKGVINFRNRLSLKPRDKRHVFLYWLIWKEIKFNQEDYLCIHLSPCSLYSPDGCFFISIHLTNHILPLINSANRTSAVKLNPALLSAVRLSGLGFKGEGYGKGTLTQMQILKDKRQD